ncbi:13916_t:CDS:2 [Ambispora leptoticha]|uniref:13916_t:CDS:1 n=1 Tax=Ambispora leptoticha TaxID=144679 RepID=A0A9N9C0V6_9GLOM|nr:13916_t:CDS:2 [Ambispora leptoticha]
MKRSLPAPDLIYRFPNSMIFLPLTLRSKVTINKSPPKLPPAPTRPEIAPTIGGLTKGTIPNVVPAHAWKDDLHSYFRQTTTKHLCRPESAGNKGSAEEANKETYDYQTGCTPASLGPTSIRKRTVVVTEAMLELLTSVRLRLRSFLIVGISGEIANQPVKVTLKESHEK